MFNKNQSPLAANPKKLETIIGPSVRVDGNFKGEGDLLIEGTLVGAIETENNLKIGHDAIIEANIRANNAYISGKVKGNLIIKGHLDIASTAIVLGDIKAQNLSVENGALLQGKISMPTGKIILADKPKEASDEKGAEEEDETETK